MRWALPVPVCPAAGDRNLHLLVFLLPTAPVEHQGEGTQIFLPSLYANSISETILAVRSELSARCRKTS
ncbi:hypothetical protein D3C80_926650 [compost metagenome]